MRSFLWTAAAAAVAVVAVGTAPAYALRVAFMPAPQRAIGAEAVVVGKVTGFAKDTVEAPSPYAGAKDKQTYKIALVKVESGLSGVGKATEVKVGFIPPPKVDPNVKPPVGIRPIPGGRFGQPELKEGQELLLFLAKHPTADFYVIPGMSPPIDVSNEQGKKELEAVKKITAVLADPMKGLKSDKADVRAETAAALVLKYRSYPANGGQVDQVAIPADESKLILAALAGGEWSNARFDAGPNALQAFYQLGLTPKDGWVQPVIVNQPGAPPVDFNAVMKDAFIKWLEGPGKNYQIKKFAPKGAAEEK